MSQVSAVVENNRRLCHDIEIARTKRDNVIADALKKANTEAGSFQMFSEADMAFLFEVKKMRQSACAIEESGCDEGNDAAVSNEDKFLVENVTALFRKLERAVTPTKRQISTRGTTERRPLCALQNSSKYQCYVNSVDCPVEPIDLRKVSVDSDECRLTLMKKLQVLKDLSVSEESPFLTKRITSAAAGCSKHSGWRHSVTKPAYTAKRRNYSKQLFSIYDSLILMHGITTKGISAKAEALLAACLTVIYPDFIVNRMPCVGYPYDHDDPGVIYWMPVRFEGNITDFHVLRAQIDDAPNPNVERQVCADLGMRFKHISYTP